MDFKYVKKEYTEITLEIPSENNEYITDEIYTHGFNQIEMAEVLSYPQSLLIMFTGDLPEKKKVKLFEVLLISLMNLGIRHPATRAVRTAAVSKTSSELLLPLSLNVLSGEENGALEVKGAVEFIQENINKDPIKLSNEILKNYINKGEEEHIMSGIGNQYSQLDIWCKKVFKLLKEIYPEGKYINWLDKLLIELNKKEVGILREGLVAVVCCELGINSRMAVGIYQYIHAPSLIAHGNEMLPKPITDIPVIEDNNVNFNKEK